MAKSLRHCIRYLVRKGDQIIAFGLADKADGLDKAGSLYQDCVVEKVGKLTTWIEGQRWLKKISWRNIDEVENRGH